MVLISAIEAHLALVKAQRDVALNEDNAARMQAHVDAAGVRVQAGAATPTRLAEAEARLARAESTLIIARTALRNAKDEFHSITGYEATQLAVPAPDHRCRQALPMPRKLAVRNIRMSVGRKPMKPPQCRGSTRCWPQ